MRNQENERTNANEQCSPQQHPTPKKKPKSSRFWIGTAVVSLLDIVLLVVLVNMLFDSPQPQDPSGSPTGPTFDTIQPHTVMITNEPTTVTAEESATEEIEMSLEWELTSDGTLLIRGNGDMDVIWGIDKKPWFSKRYQIKHVIIEDGVTNIGDYAFYRHIYLTDISIPESVTRIGINAFNECDRLLEISIPNSVTSIGEMAFMGCDSFTSITIPEMVTNIGDSAFYGCNDLKDVFLGNNIDRIGNHAFRDCKSIVELKLPDSVTSIGDYAFSNCISLTNMVIPNGVKYINDSIFDGCKSLISITIPNSVTYLHLFGAYKLQYLYYLGTREEWDSIDKGIPYDVEVIYQ